MSVTNEWTIGKIGDICIVGDGAHAKIERQISGVMYLTSKNLKEGRLDISQISYISEKDFNKHFRDDSKALTKMKPNDVIFSIIGTIGEPYLVNSGEGFGISSSVAILRPNESVLFPKYLFYWIKNRIFQNALYSIKGGVAQGYISLEMIRSLPLYYSSLFSQKKIASILSSYDDLIENNARRIEILEQMAKLIYEEWFVKFKFPGHENVKMVSSDSGEIPVEWKVKKLPDLCSKVIDGTHDSPKPSEDGYFLVTGKHIINGFIDFSKCYKISPDEHFKVIQRSKPEKGDIIFSNIGTLGNIVIVDQDFEFSIKNVALFKPLESFYSCYLYLHFSSLETYNRLMRKASGTSQKFFSLNFLRNLEIIEPPKEVICKFDKIVKPIIEHRSLLNRKNQNLRKTCDLLLPTLISGEIDISDLDINIEDKHQISEIKEAENKFNSINSF